MEDRFSIQTFLKSGQICFYNHASVKIIEEKINIKIIDDFAIYDIIYYFENNSEDTLQMIDYAFPVDYSSFTPFSKDSREITNIPYFEMYFENKKLEIKEQTDINYVHDSVYIKLTKKEKPDRGIDYSYFKRKWYISQFAFRTKKTYTLQVKYKIQNNSSDILTSKDVFKKYGTRNLVYDFSPASYWGNGVIDKITIQIDVKDIIKEKIEVKGLENWARIDDMYIFYQEYFKPENKSFALNYSNVIGGNSKDILKNKIPLKYLKIESNVNCDYNHLNDINFSTNCNFRNLKDSIVFNLLNNKNAFYITILTGDYSSEKNFNDHGRAKKLKLEYEIREFRDSKSFIVKIDTIITIPEFKYFALNQDNFMRNSILFQLKTNIFNIALIKAKITILETYPGKKYTDVCFTELLFNSQLFNYDEESEAEKD